MGEGTINGFRKRRMRESFVRFSFEQTQRQKWKYLTKENRWYGTKKYGSQLNVNRRDTLVDVHPVRRKHCANL